MLQKPKCPVIALEEHYYDQELVAQYGPVERNAAVVERRRVAGPHSERLLVSRQRLAVPVTSANKRQLEALKQKLDQLQRVPRR